MKVKILTMTTLFVCGQILVNAQNSTFKKGDKVLNLGIGFGGYSPSGYQLTTPSASASYEVGIKDKDSNKGSLAIGGYLGYASYEESHTSTTNPAATYGYASYFEKSSLAATNNNYWSVNRIMIGVRGAYHYHLADKLDTYGGVTLGIIARSWKWNGPTNRTDHPSKKPFSGDLFVGGRYYFSDQFAALGELGLGAYLTLGIAMKL